MRPAKCRNGARITATNATAITAAAEIGIAVSSWCSHVANTKNSNNSTAYHKLGGLHAT